MRPVDVAVFTHRSRQRGKIIARAMYKGIIKCGDRPVMYYPEQYKGPKEKVAVFYGLSGHLPRVWDDYRLNPELRAVYVDLGYWGRKVGGTFAGYHKVSVDNRHPTKYFQKVRHGDKRRKAVQVEIEEKRRGEAILLAGMGEKGANWEGFAAEEWERAAIKSIRKCSERPIIYRPKPSWTKAQPIEGTDFRDAERWSIDQLLNETWCVVSHHSNVSGDGLIRGIPCLTDEGVAKVLAGRGYREIDELKPPPRSQIVQWVNDVCHCQFNVDEMARGICWGHLKEEGLVC